MIQLIGLNSNCTIEIRERFAINKNSMEDCLGNLLKFCKEVLIINTCNRTEVYYNSETYGEENVEKLFDALGWEYSLNKYTFHITGSDVSRHIMEVACGFHSRIMGEDQILGQIKHAYGEAYKTKSVNGELQRLFQLAITCGKEFRFKTRLNRIPVSAPSIAVSEGRRRNLKNFMIIGFGDMGKLAAKYIMSGEFEKLYIAVRNIDSVNLKNERVCVVDFNYRKHYYENVDCIISCTSAPNTVVNKEDLPYKELLIFDLALPRDVEENANKLDNVEVYSIDDLSSIDVENKEKRRQVMNKNKWIINSYIEKFVEWQSIREIAPKIKEFEDYKEEVCSKRYAVFRNKKYTKDNDKLVETLIKSTSNVYINRAIEVLKEEQLKGGGKECLRILEKVFNPVN
jgi:glutamyl-tRNA reductase